MSFTVNLLVQNIIFRLITVMELKRFVTTIVQNKQFQPAKLGFIYNNTEVRRTYVYP